MSSLYQRQAPFQVRLGSISSAFITCTSDEMPQYAGSPCVVNCWMSLKKPFMWPDTSAS